MGIFVISTILVSILLVSQPTDGHRPPNDVRPNEARYDNYRLYRVKIVNDEQVAMFQDLERISDSCIFYGHARNVGQELTILVSAHKIADFTELLQRYVVEHRILVCV